MHIRPRCSIYYTDLEIYNEYFKQREFLIVGAVKLWMKTRWNCYSWTFGFYLESLQKANNGFLKLFWSQSISEIYLNEEKQIRIVQI